MNNYLDLNDLVSLNKEFCKTIDLKPTRCALINMDTGDIRVYESISSLYKKPKGWENVKAVRFQDPVYPDFTTPDNFLTLLNVQWELFGNLGGQYNRMSDENFIANYIYNKIRAVQTLRSYGGSEMLEEFINRIHNIDYKFEVLVDGEYYTNK